MTQKLGLTCRSRIYSSYRKTCTCQAYKLNRQLCWPVSKQLFNFPLITKSHSHYYTPKNVYKNILVLQGAVVKEHCIIFHIKLKLIWITMKGIRKTKIISFSDTCYTPHMLRATNSIHIKASVYEGKVLFNLWQKALSMCILRIHILFNEY